MDKFSWADPPGQTAFPIAKAGYPMIFGSAFVTAVFALLGLTAPALTGLVVTLAICCFFRDPDRVIPNAADGVVSPADGKVIFVDQVSESPFLEGPRLKISVFMSVLNVHVNRVPFTGRVREIVYHPGKFFSANLDKASKDNEHNAVTVETETGQEICFVQIAGLIARRIICKIQPGDAVVRGQRFGIICFGSRLDIYLPPDFRPDVSVGDRVSAGASVLGCLTAPSSH
ncbi:phosphatidylserine decarboxylase [Desulfonema ishimotonii]|uniref:Phosphatidylserine decarboxylase proenzyme n=1 Tax=Desulfonema ishimotonii TaxID=45657 RepID=A0A401FRM4_9BACT|nr:phosphatidylserine decarboxylase family protein [Desulfonema ishimotonii]GBC59617.1 phosphatidylserine decarboxylase [Desulfonema ishimotonii]